jgi:hypothetical protein
MIGQSGLLLVSGLFAVPVLVLWVELGKSRQLNLDVRNILQDHVLSIAGVAIRNLNETLMIRICKIFSHEKLSNF